MTEENTNRFPLNGTLELTARCNLHCKMCFIRIDKKRILELGGRERTSREWILMAKEILEAGTGALLITGGEPMLRPDFVEIYEAIAKMGFMLTLYTNATLITDEIMEVLQQYPPHSIGITVYGASPGTYEKVTGSANAYYKMLEGVDKLKQLPSFLTIRTTIIKDNLKDLRQMTEWAYGIKEDVSFQVSRVVTKPVRGGVGSVEECRLSPIESMKMLQDRRMEYTIKPLIKLLKEDADGFVEKMKALNLDKDHKQDNKTLYGCNAGMTSYTISWDGKLLGCQMLGDCWTYPFDIGFQSAWDDFPKMVQLPMLPEECIGCKATCNACPANRLSETGCLGGLPEYLCEESKLVDEMEGKILSKIKILIQKGDD